MADALIVRETAFQRRKGAGHFSHVTTDEVHRMIGDAPTEQTRLLVKVLWATGARVSEIIGLSAADLDANRRALQIHRKKRRNAFAQELPIPADLASELRLFIRAKRRRSRIFTGDRSSIYRTVRRLGQKVLGRRIGPHQFRHGKACGVIEAKKEGTTLTGVEIQAEKYSAGLPDIYPAHLRPLPFLYQSTGSVTQFTNRLDPDARSRLVFQFHRPETLAGLLATPALRLPGVGARDLSVPTDVKLIFDSLKN